MIDEDFYIHKLEHRGIKPTATRLLILRAMCRGDETVSLPQLERLLPTVDKSTIRARSRCSCWANSYMPLTTGAAL